MPLYSIFLRVYWCLINVDFESALNVILNMLLCIKNAAILIYFS